ncbi:5' DNA nuclease [Allorhizobium undicola]|uniref:5' DNA nuclease n=1 Tax=Allorhizobium undicola TaxID=78527 RepID=UPI003D34252E
MDLPTMLANPVVTAAAATMAGLGFATQMAGFVLGSWQKALNGVLDEETRSEVVSANSEPEVPVAEASSLQQTEAGASDSVISKPVKSKRAEAATSVPAKSGRSARKRSSDDLKKISGIGPKVESMLQQAGITRFSQIASWSTDEALRMDAELGLDGRVLRDDWVGQAKQIKAPAAGASRKG